MADEVKIYKGPDLKFGRQTIVSGTRFFIDADSGEVLLAGHSDFQFLTPPIIDSMVKNGESTGESPAQYWPVAYNTMLKRKSATARLKPVSSIGPSVEVTKRSKFHYVKYKPSSSGDDLVAVSMPGVARHDINVDIQPISDRLRTGKFAALDQVFAPSDATMNVVREKVLPYLGLLSDLPMRRLYYAESHKEPTCLASLNIEGRSVGVIVVNLDSAKRNGGYNSWNVGQSLTHEVAHYIYSSVMRNTTKAAFNEACRPKSGAKINSRAGEDGYSFNTEQFAVLAETLVWGSALRKLDCLNGIDQVRKYFVNNWIPEEDLRDPMSYIR